MFTCTRCDRSFDLYNQLLRHTYRLHKISSPQLYVETFLNNVWPLCQCGCGTKVAWRSPKFQKYVNGHNGKVANGMTGKTHSTEAKANISSKRKAKFAAGEYRVWQTEDTQETRDRLANIAQANKSNIDRGRKISKALTGVQKSTEHKINSKIAITKAWQNPVLRELQSHKRILWMRETDKITTSKLEKIFEKLLIESNIGYHAQHYIRDIKALYDFYVKKSDGTYILIEIHGDFWHCNPDTKHKIPKYDSQIKNIKNDERKRLWCELNNIPLLIFWESDIKKNPDKILTELQTALS